MRLREIYNFALIIFQLAFLENRVNTWFTVEHMTIVRRKTSLDRQVILSYTVLRADSKKNSGFGPKPLKTRFSYFT